MKLENYFADTVNLDKEILETKISQILNSSLDEDALYDIIDNIYINITKISKKKLLIRFLKTYNKKEKQESENSDKLILEKILQNLPYYIWCRDIKCQTIYSNKLDENAQRLMLSSADGMREAIENRQKISSAKNIVIKGEMRNFNINEIPIEIAGKSFSLGIASDISKMESIKRELASYILMYRDLLDASSHAVAFYSSDRRLVFYNNVFMKMWQFEEQWLDTKPLYDEILLRILNKSNFDKNLYTKYQRDQVRMFYSLTETYNDFLHLKAGGTIRAVVVPNNIGGLLFNYEYIHENKAIEQHKQNFSVIFEKFLESLNAPIGIFTNNGQLYACNSHYANLIHREKKHGQQILESEADITHSSDIMKILGMFSKNEDDIQSNIITTQAKLEIITMKLTDELKIVFFPEVKNTIKKV